MSLYPQAPQSIGQVLDSGLGLYRQLLKPMLPLSIVLALLGQAPQLMPYLAGGGTPGVGFGVGAVVAFIAWFVINIALYAGWIRSMDGVARGQARLGVGAAFGTGLKKTGSMIGASILFGFAVVVGLLLLVVPGIILMTSLLFFGYLVVLEDRPAVASLRESHALVWGNWWRTATVVFVAGVIYFVALAVVSGIVGVMVGIGFTGPQPDDVARGIGLGVLVYVVAQVALNALLMPMWTAMMLVQFRDLQLRKSGSDLAARAAVA